MTSWLKSGRCLPKIRNLQRGRDLAGHAGHQRGPESHWVRPAGFVFRGRRCQDLFDLADLKRPEAAFKMFIRFVLAKAAVGYGLDLMLAVFKIIQGMVSTIITQSGLSGSSGTTLPQEIIDKINNVGFWDSIPLWAVTLLGGLFITVLAFIMILTVYSRLFKLYMYTAIAPIPMSTFAGEPPAAWARTSCAPMPECARRGHHRAGLHYLLGYGASPPAVDPTFQPLPPYGATWRAHL